MSKDGLKKVYLIKSAGYEFVEIDIADNTLLLGESGVGKTTLMRAVLFFYTMDYSDSVLNLTSETKKSFNDWYFREHNSHIIYEYTRDDNKYLFIVSKTSKLHYTFIEITNLTIGVRDIFIDKNMPVNFEKLNETIQKNSLPSYTTTIKDRYINIFHKKDEFGKKIKNETPIDFSLFEDLKSRKEFARTLSNIFASSSIKSTNIKKTIVSLIDNSSAKIALYDIKTNLNKFSVEKKEIEKFEKKIPIIKNLANEFSKYKQNKQEFKQLANKVEYIQKHSVFKIQEIDLKLEEQIKKQNEQTQKYQIKRELIEEEKSAKKTKIDIETSKLDELIKKDKDFKEKNISQLVSEYKNEQHYKDEQKSLRSRYEALTSNVKEIEDNYTKILSQLKQSYNEKVLESKQELLEKIDIKKENINKLVRGKEKKILEATNNYVYEQKDLEQKEKSLNKELIELNKREGEMKHFPFNKDKIDKYEDSIKIYAEELLKLKSNLVHNEIDIKEIEKEILSVKETLANDLKSLNEKYENAKNILLEKKQNIEKRLDFESKNLYGYLNKNDVKNKERIVTYLKDEILFSDKNFTIKDSTDNNSIFGLDIEFEDEFGNEYKQEESLKELNLIKTNIKELNKQTQKSKHLLEDKASLQTKELNRQRSILYKTKDELESTKKSYIKNSDQVNLDLVEVKKDAKRLRDNTIKELNEELITLNEKMRNNSERLNFLITKIESETLAINQFVDSETRKTDKQIRELNDNNVLESKKLESEFIKEEQKCNGEKLEALKEKGVDKVVLNELISKGREIGLKIENIEKNRKYVYLFLELEDELEKIPLKQNELKKQEVLYSAIQNQLNELAHSYEESDKIITKDIKEFKDSKNSLNLFLKKYTQKVENQKIQIKLHSVLTFNFKMEIDKIDVDDIEELITVFDNIKNNETEIKALVLRSLRDLKTDNLFKIDIPKDFIEDIEYTKTAIELVEYIQKDKLTPLKDALSEQFKGEIRKIIKELDIFEDALLDIKAQIKALANSMRKAVESFNVIDSIDIKAEDTNNNLLFSLKSLADFYAENSDSFLNGLFDTTMQETKKIKNNLDNKVVEVVELLNSSKESLELEDGFVLEFKIVEKGNNLKWRQNIDDIGSNGTSTLVKSIINISMLQMVSKNIVKNNQILTHCVLDEIGTISTDYFKELKEFVNRSGFVFLNGMPIEDDMLISMYPTIYVGQNHNNYSKMILASKMEI